MNDAQISVERAAPAAIAGAPPGGFRAAVRRARQAVRLHHVLFLAFLVVAAVPTSVLALWEERVSYQHELQSVRERHLLVARNLTSTMSRYVRDVKSAFTVVFESGALDHPTPGLADLLASLNVIHVCVVAPDGTVQRWLRGLAPAPGPTLDPGRLAELKALAATTNGAPAISDLQHDASGRPVFLLVQALPDNRLGYGVLSTDYLISLQQAIAFGDRGHAAIVDTKGRIIAHPLKDWVAASHDVSALPIVAAMRRGETGVTQFHSAALDDDMIAGFAVVPETGWGVMVPQPVSELRRRAGQVASMVTVIAVVSFAAAALMSWLIAFYIARPVRQVARTAEAVLAGAEDAAAPRFSDSVPLEIRRLGLAFNTMLSALRRRNSETELALRLAEQSNLAKTQFLANMSHEIRTPLNGVVGMIELLRLSDPTPAQQGLIESATQSSEALLYLIVDNLDVSRIEAGRLELEQAPFELRALIDEVRSLYADQARAKRIAFATTLGDGLDVTLLGDAHRLQQILTNLVGNAVKFTAEGSVTLDVACLEDRGSSLWLRFTVTDTGIGIPIDKQQTIFEAFAQADSSTTRRYGGTGLGLSIARQLCRLMGGQIGVDSAEGKGSTFWFTVTLERPRAMNACPPANAKPPAAPPADVGVHTASAAEREFRHALGRIGRSAIHILLVEDNAANLRVTQALLEAIGCTVTTARNGLEGVAACRAAAFDLILMDCQMPEMDGYEAARAIRRLEASQERKTPIVALTAHALDGSRELSLAAGMNDHLTKPLTLNVLIAKLVTWLGTPAERRTKL